MDTVALIGRLLVSLAAVLGLMWVIARRMKRGGRGKRTQLIDVLGRQQLSRTASVAVVRVADQALVIGVTDSHVSVLGETDLGAAEALSAAASDTPRPRTRATTHRVRVQPTQPATRLGPQPATAQPDPEQAAGPSGALAGSALSPQTWRQTLNSLRDLTARQS